MIDYNKMSDFEINKAVAEELYKDRLSLIVQRDVPSRPAVTVFCDIGNEEIVSIVCADYCNNPADAWPIILKNRISINTIYLGGWRASIPYGFECDFRCDNENPLRAAMACFLLMKANW